MLVDSYFDVIFANPFLKQQLIMRKKEDTGQNIMKEALQWPENSVWNQKEQSKSEYSNSNKLETLSVLTLSFCEPELLSDSCMCGKWNTLSLCARNINKINQICNLSLKLVIKSVFLQRTITVRPWDKRILILNESV